MHGRDIARQAANVLAIPLGIVLGCVPSLHPSSVAAVARHDEPLLASAGWTFTIWGILFAGQLAYALYQALPSQRARALHRRIGWLTAANGLLGGAWTLAFTHHQLTAAWVIMLVLLANLISIEILLGDDARSGRDLWLARIPYGFNLGWIAVASILETTQLLGVMARYDGTPLSPLAWALFMVTAAATLGVVMAMYRANVAFAVAVAWGLCGIASYRLEVYPALGVLAYVLAGGLLTLVAVELVASSRIWLPSARHTLHHAH